MSSDLLVVTSVLALRVISQWNTTPGTVIRSKDIIFENFFLPSYFFVVLFKALCLLCDGVLSFSVGESCL